jgi:hypothetical protein
VALKAAQPTLEEIADLCLAHLVENPEQLADFMSITGWSPAALQRAAKDGSLAPGLLDYVVQNEPLLMAVCQSASVSPEAVMRVWARLNPAG